MSVYPVRAVQAEEPMAVTELETVLGCATAAPGSVLPPWADQKPHPRPPELVAMTE
jgi:hypothetical protein